MRDWISGLAGAQYADAILLTLGALLVLALVLFGVKLVRGMNSGTFVAGGRNRRPRLAVMDATAVDTHRRLVLVRRDDVEHLVLIGGPTDVVVEQNIRVQAQAPARRPSSGPRPIDLDTDLDDLVRPAEQAPVAAPPPPPAPEPRPQPQRPQAAPPPAEPARRAPEPAPVQRAPAPARPQPQSQPQIQPSAPSAAPRPAEPRPPVMRPAQPIAARPAQPRPAPPPPPQPAADSDELDDALMSELEISMDEEEKIERKPVSLDDEMTRLLGELSGRNRR
ncbi:MAG: hypothetical protein DI629_07050 [Mesorhizobium amorphae]|nr:MAG: hypothetical protein DI629_07050 [Mesorhizobium amorphae]